MLYIVGNLFTGWLLSLFNFDNLVINSMSSLFNISITHGDYYFIFAWIGIIKSILRHINGGPIFDIDND